jgi:kumamolisin
MPDYTTIPGSTPVPLQVLDELGPVGAGETATITLILRRRAELPTELIVGPQTITRDELAERYGADPADVALLRDALPDGLSVVAEDLGGRTIRISGSVDALATFFGVQLTRVASANPMTGQRVEHRHRTGSIQVPAQLTGIVTAVLGLDDRPHARLQSRIAAADAVEQSYTPVQVGTIYDFPANTDGTGQTLAIIELGGGYADTDLNSYFDGLGITPPTVKSVSVDGAKNTPGQDPSGADGEVLLDIEVSGALAPKAEVDVYFAPNTDQGFIDAITNAVHATPTPTAISVSWGQSEDSWTAQSRTALDQACADGAALGVTICAAAGDGGSSDGQSDGKPHADFPASSPNVLACGGTTLNSSTDETVWNSGSSGGATGGGVSDVFDQPSWQANAGVPSRPGGGTGRGVPDVAGDADPATGYQVLVDGQQQVIGGTSAVAPLWAALVCRLAQGAGRKLGQLQPTLYSASTGFRDITSGSNGDYSAGPGWDACTGLGVPVGSDLLSAFSAPT